jgi:hypothetical protein
LIIINIKSKLKDKKQKHWEFRYLINIVILLHQFTTPSLKRRRIRIYVWIFYFIFHHTQVFVHLHSFFITLWSLFHDKSFMPACWLRNSASWQRYSAVDVGLTCVDYVFQFYSFSFFCSWCCLYIVNSFIKVKVWVKVHHIVWV